MKIKTFILCKIKAFPLQMSKNNALNGQVEISPEESKERIFSLSTDYLCMKSRRAVIHFKVTFTKFQTRMYTEVYLH